MNKELDKATNSVNVRDKQPRLWIIIPCYNEEQVLPITSKTFLEILTTMEENGKISKDSRVLFVNDGSKDKTWEIIKDLSEENEHFIGISQSRNRGHQNAVLAGLMEAKNHCDITISIDCDGQDDPKAMYEMVDKYISGAEIVYGVRSKRTTDTFFKRFTAEGFYHLLNWMGAEVVFNHADYRLVSSKVLQHFAEFKEVNLFLRGMIPLVGFKSETVYYERAERIAGESHYPLKKMLALAFDGITSLSVKPIRMITCLGAIMALIGVLGAIRCAIVAFGSPYGELFTMSPEITSTIWFVGGIQVMCLGIVGEYVGKIYMETKARPRYIISETSGDIN